MIRLRERRRPRGVNAAGRATRHRNFKELIVRHRRDIGFSYDSTFHGSQTYIYSVNSTFVPIQEPACEHFGREVAAGESMSGVEGLHIARAWKTSCKSN